MMRPSKWTLALLSQGHNRNFYHHPRGYELGPCLHGIIPGSYTFWRNRPGYEPDGTPVALNLVDSGNQQVGD